MGLTHNAKEKSMLDNLKTAIDTLSTTWPLIVSTIGLFAIFCISMIIYERYTDRVRLKKPFKSCAGAIRRGF